MLVEQASDIQPVGPDVVAAGTGVSEDDVTERGAGSAGSISHLCGPLRPCMLARAIGYFTSSPGEIVSDIFAAMQRAPAITNSSFNGHYRNVDLIVADCLLMEYHGRMHSL